MGEEIALKAMAIDKTKALSEYQIPEEVYVFY